MEHKIPEMGYEILDTQGISQIFQLEAYSDLKFGLNYPF